MTIPGMSMVGVESLWRRSITRGVSVFEDVSCPGFFGCLSMPLGQADVNSAVPPHLSHSSETTLLKPQNKTTFLFNLTFLKNLVTVMLYIGITLD